jgi:hypothetical protein
MNPLDDSRIAQSTRTLMSTPGAPRTRSEHEVRLRIRQPAASPALILLLSEIRSRAFFGAVKRFTLDCSEITELPLGVLVDLAELRAELRAAGSDLALVNCQVKIRQELMGRSYAALLGDVAKRHGSHSLSGPHAAFLQAFQAGA